MTVLWIVVIIAALFVLGTVLTVLKGIVFAVKIIAFPFRLLWWILKGIVKFIQLFF